MHSEEYAKGYIAGVKAMKSLIRAEITVIRKEKNSGIVGSDGIKRFNHGKEVRRILLHVINDMQRTLIMVEVE